MRYYKRENLGQTTHVWITRLHLESSSQRIYPLGIDTSPQLPSAVSDILATLVRKTVFWLHEPTDSFGIYGENVCFAFPADLLVYIQMEHQSTFRGAALTDVLRVYSLIPRDRPEWIDLGVCTPTNPVRDPERNRDRVRAELKALAQSSLFQDRFDRTVSFVHCNDPY
jgi:hypothetical protein